jgi:pantoate--beta-alanine ligase
MHVVRTLPQLREACAALADRDGLGLVPTMGALHDGHLALIHAARARHRAVGASIFVNPIQFAANEDLGHYPRQEAADLAMLAEAGCDLVWLPEVATMYPPGDGTVVEVAGPAARWEGAQRPGHFRGVATVVAKLFGQTRATRGYFGEKDWQQLQVVRRMTLDLHLPVEVIGVPTVREPDGLAMSSRNRFLTPAQRDIAPQLYAALQAAAAALTLKADHAEICAQARAALVTSGFTVDYFEVVDASSLEPVNTLEGSARLIAAARLGKVRLLDNIAVVVGCKQPTLQGEGEARSS